MWNKRAFGIRTKLLLPGVAALALLLALMQLVWLPWQQEGALTRIKQEQSIKLEILSLALAAPLFTGDLGQAHNTLEAVLEANPTWRQLELTNAMGQRLYPLERADAAALAGMAIITHAIILKEEPLAQLTPGFNPETTLGQLTLHFDPTAQLAQHSAEILLVSLIIFACIAAGLTLNFVLQDWLIRRPVEQMADVARTLAQGEFDTPITLRSRDEIGRLAIALETMRTHLRAMTAELRQNEQRLLAVVTHIPDGIFTVQADGTIESANAAACAMFDYEAHELTGHNVNILIPPKQRAQHHNWMASAEHRSRVVNQGAIATNAVRRGERLFPAEFKIAEITGQQEPLYLALVQDITERQHHEQLLRTAMAEMEREKNTLQAIFLGTMASSTSEIFRLSAMTAATALEADGVIVSEIADPAPHRAQTLAVWQNEAFQENFEYSLEQAPCTVPEGQDYLCVAEQASTHYPDCPLLAGTEAFVAMPFFNGRGVAIGQMTILFRRPIQDEARSVAIMKIFATRLSAELERAAAERTREEQARHTQTILDNLTEGIITIDEHGIVTAFNHAAESIFGYGATEVLGHNIKRLMPEPDCSQHDGYLTRYLATGEKQTIGMSREVTGRRKDGAIFLMELQVSQISRAGHPIFIGVVRDITERKNAEAERQRLQLQLAQAQKMEAIGQLTGGVAHDFNNMLAGILGFSELSLEIAQTLDNASLCTYLTQINRAGERARDLVAKMLAFSRSRDVSTPEPVQLSSAIPEMMKMLRPLLPASVAISTEFDPATAPILLDTIELQQVLMNLCINARDAMGGSGTLTIALRKSTWHNAVCSACQQGFSGDYVELSVSDSGPGMDANTLQRVFEPFFTTKEVGKGTGMGLAMVHGIVHDRHGHIVVESKPGKGCCFRLLFKDATQELGA